MLPPLASSLAYSNYTAWVEEHDGAELPDVAPGVSVEDLYRSSEREVRSQAAFLLRWRKDGVAATVAVFLAHMNMLLDAATHTHTPLALCCAPCRTLLSHGCNLPLLTMLFFFAARHTGGQVDCAVGGTPGPWDSQQ